MNATIDFTEVILLKDFKVLGYTTDFNKCECCGKEGLKGTVSILDINTDVVVHYGTTCAAAANKYDTLDAVKKAKKEIVSAVKSYNDSINFARSIARKILSKKYGHSGAPEYRLLAPADAIEGVMTSCEMWYTNPLNKFKPFPQHKY